MNTNASITCTHATKTFVTYRSRVFALALPSETLIKFNLNDISIWIIRSYFHWGTGKSDMKRETIWSSELVSKMRHPETDTCEQIFAPFEQLVNKWTLGTRKNYIYYYEVFDKIMCTSVTNKTILLIILYFQACERKTNELQESDHFCLSLIKKTGEMGAVTITVKNEVLVIIYTIFSCVLPRESISTQLIKNEHMMVRYTHLIF
jgi:hypothetical protein